MSSQEATHCRAALPVCLDTEWSPAGEVGFRSARRRSCGARYQTWGTQGTEQQTATLASRWNDSPVPTVCQTPRGEVVLSSPSPWSLKPRHRTKGGQSWPCQIKGGKGVDGEGGRISWYGWRTSPVDLPSVESTFTGRRVPLESILSISSIRHCCLYGNKTKRTEGMRRRQESWPSGCHRSRE